MYNVSIEGTFDDCQDVVKQLFSDSEFKEKYQLGAINSINWARILAQTTYYFASYFSILKQKGYTSIDEFSKLEKVQYSVPTGNFGDILAGFFARQMGLPIHKLIIATNENDILYRFLTTGIYEKCGQVKETLSPAMDILVSSNFERLLWYLLNADGSSISNSSSETSRSAASIKTMQLMEDLKNKSRFSVNAEVLSLARSIFASHKATDKDSHETIRKYYAPSNSESYVLDPHTAVGVKAAEHIIKTEGSPEYLTICLSTASPGKFPEAVLDALNTDGHEKVKFSDIAPQQLVDLSGKPKRMTIVTNNGNLAKAAKDVRSIISETIKAQYH